MAFIIHGSFRLSYLSVLLHIPNLTDAFRLCTYIVLSKYMYPNMFTRPCKHSTFAGNMGVMVGLCSVTRETLSMPRMTINGTILYSKKFVRFTTVDFYGVIYFNV